MVLKVKLTLSLFFILLSGSKLFSQERYFETQRLFDSENARQGVAVDDKHVYAINNYKITKHDKKTNSIINTWEDKSGKTIHLDSGVVIEGKLYCAHSNYPNIPMTSSIEIWDAETLKHIGSHSFGIRWGSCTWVDYHDGNWYASFAQYKKWEHITGKDSSWTTIVKFDDQWNELSAWVFPEEVIEKFDKMSNSGGSFGPDGLLYCSGHDNPELYVMQFPESGSELELIEILSIDSSGQGLSWDRSDENFIYTINKKERKVIVSKLIEQL